jgi:alpha-tubulin suppressor-like RCC1 family protein
VSGVQGVIAMSAGSYHTCALLASGAAECWGDNTGNVLGGATTVVQTSVPLPVTGGVAFSAISSGEADTCGLAAGGSVYCWGPRFNTDGTIAQSNNPSPILGGLSFATISVGTGTMQVCGITTGSAAYCMGPNASGQIGDGTIFLRPAPVAVNTTQAFTLIGTSNANTCGLTTSGAAFCWGANNSGQLGSGGSTASQLSPVPVIGGLTFAALSTGVQHSCAITAAGAAYCWGLNSSGQLGNGTTSASSSATPPGAVTGGLTFAKIAAGLAHTCALTPAGVAYCWGNNFDGGLGNGTVTNRTSPVAVAGGLTFAGITSGASHTCAWTQAGTAYCWGDNAEGQIGDGTSTPLIPVLIPLP